MATLQENLYSASRIVAMVADRLIDYASCDGEVGNFELLELAGRLDLEVTPFRLANGARVCPRFG